MAGGSNVVCYFNDLESGRVSPALSAAYCRDTAAAFSWEAFWQLANPKSNPKASEK
jgi:hypothetical protein